MLRTIDCRAEDAGELLALLLTDAALTGFAFETSFTLWFSRDECDDPHDERTPWKLELRLLGDWWFGDRDAWAGRVSRLAPSDATEPSEPVLAYDLAHLRWSEGASVERITLEVNALRVHFANGVTLVASCEETGDEVAWSLSEYGIPESEWRWLVSCRDHCFFCRRPE
jgi:hypothetical protein